jgi:hypothetical protein
MSLQLAAASLVYMHYALKKNRKECRWWQRQLYTSRNVYSGSRLLEDLNFQSVSGLYKNFTRISPSEFKFLIILIREKISKKTASRKAISVQKGFHWRCVSWQVVTHMLACSTASEFPSKQSAALCQKCVKFLLKNWRIPYREDKYYYLWFMKEI